MLGRAGFLTIGVALFSLACVQPQAASPSPSGSESPAYGGRLNIRTDADPWDWDPSYSAKSTPNSYGLGLAYNSLLSFKHGEGLEYTDQIVEPDLAERWEVSPDARSFSFSLRKGVKFADAPPVNGREVASADVKWSFEYHSRTGSLADRKLPTAQYASMFEGLEGIDTPDASTVTVRFKEPFAPFLNYAATDLTPILAREVFEQDSHFKDRIIGSGPFILDPTASRQGSLWVWNKNPSYWQTGKPYLDEVRWLVLIGSAPAHAAFQTKQIDVLGPNASGFNATMMPDFMKANPGATLYEFIAPVGLTLYMNVSKPPVSDLKVRKALSMAIDRDEFIKLYGAGKGSWSLSGGLLGLFSQEETRRMLRYDPAEAARLVKEAGYPDGVPVELHFEREEHTSNAQLLQAQLKKGGINLILDPVNNEDESRRRKARDFQLSLVSATTADGDTDSLLYGGFHPKSQKNYGASNDPELNQLLEAQRKENDAAKRRELMREAVRVINVGKVLGQSIYSGSQYVVWHPYLHGHFPNYWRRGEQISAKDVWVTK